MANFSPTAYTKILRNEGYYVNDGDDPGGETYLGVARNKNPNWTGWPIIDAIKNANPQATALSKKGNYGPLNLALKSNLDLMDKIRLFYKVNYWDVNNLSEIKDQQLADNVCDCGVNCGVATAAKMLQKAFNVTNKYHSGFKPLVVDGKIGNKTLSAINKDNPVKIYDEYNVLRRKYYDDLIVNNPRLAKYKKSWYSRLVEYKY